MKNFRVTLLCVVVLLLAVTCSYADKWPIDYPLGHASELANKSVTVTGLVSNSAVVTVPDPLADKPIKGEFDLTDKSGTIHVRTTGDPPANGVKSSVTGTLDASTDPPVIVQTGEGPFGGPVLIYAALGVLVILAIVLVVLLAGKPKKKVPPRVHLVDPPPPTPIPTMSTGIECPSCHSRNPSDAKFCENCRTQLKGIPIVEPPLPYKPIGGTISPPLSGPAMADLTVVETTGKQQNARFELTRDTKGSKIGRNPDMTICIQGDDTVSKEHARVWWSDGDSSFFIQDENSKWGTVVNGNKVARVALNDGDEILLGKTKLVFRMIGAQVSGNQTTPPPSA